MAVISREGLATPVVPKETHPLPSLGCDVVVRGLLLSERLAFSGLQRDLNKPRGTETQEQAYGRAGAEAVPLLLAQTVLASDGLPLWAPSDWQAHGATQPAECLALFDVAWRLSGFDQGATEKN